ncbi:hypothetical protein BGW80DRAFT_1297309, partial [Lactifluus volemus]
MLFRCWLSSWAALVIILPEKSLKTMGNACVLHSLTSAAATCQCALLSTYMTVSTSMFESPFNASVATVVVNSPIRLAHGLCQKPRAPVPQSFFVYIACNR